MRWLGVFLAANAALLLVALYALGRASILGAEPVAAGIIGGWAPGALAGATIGSALVASLLPGAQRPAFLFRHFALYLAVPALLLVLLTDGGFAHPTRLGPVYLLMAVGFAVHALAGLAKIVETLSDRRAALCLAAIVLVPFLVLMPWNAARAVMASDEPHYMLISQSLIYDADLDLRNDYDGDRYLRLFPERLPDIHGFEVGSAIYSVRDLALPVIAALPLALAGRIGVLALMCVVGAALAFQTYLLLRDLWFAPRVALVAVGATALTHPLLTYTTQIYPELLSALTFVCAARVLRKEAPTPRDLAVLSLLIALLPWLSTRTWPMVVGLGLVVAYVTFRPLVRPAPGERGRGLRDKAIRIGAATLPFAGLILILASANWSMFGRFIPGAGYQINFPAEFLLTMTPHVGGVGMLFDRVFGLIPRAPLYLLAFLGAFSVWQRLRSSKNIALAGLFAGWLASFVYLANIVFWHADGGPSSRYLVSTMPFLVVAVAGGWEAIERHARWREGLRAAAWILIGASVVITYVFAVLPDLRYDYAVLIRESGGHGRFFTFLGDRLGEQPGAVFPSLLHAGPFSVASAVAWTGVAVALVLLGRRLVRREAVAP